MEREVKYIDEQAYLLCKRCKKWLPISNFSIDKSNLHKNRGNFCLHCDDCQYKKYKNYRERLADPYRSLRRKLQMALNGARRRSKDLNRYFDLDINYLLYLWAKQNGKCALTGFAMTHEFFKGRMNTTVSIDRIDSSKGYTRDNVQLVCMVANQM